MEHVYPTQPSHSHASPAGYSVSLPLFSSSTTFPPPLPFCRQHYADSIQWYIGSATECDDALAPSTAR